MSLPISKIMNLDLDENKETKSRATLNEFPERYSKLKGLQEMKGKNHSYDLGQFDRFNIAMKQTKNKKGMSDLYLDIKNKVKKPYGFEQTDGWIDPAQRRRQTDPNHAPPYDYVFGSNFQKFDNDNDERISHNNVDLIRKAHESYYNFIYRYDAKPLNPMKNPMLNSMQNPMTMPYLMPNMGIVPKKN
ncbi:MAG: hypothetical protein V4589_05565 [Bacteroidota bacterium]